jgi:hypothetical protein
MPHDAYGEPVVLITDRLGPAKDSTSPYNNNDEVSQNSYHPHCIDINDAFGTTLWLA